MSVSGISGYGNNYYATIASGKRINSAADDAAGLAIAEKLETQSNGYDIGADNAASGKDMLNVAEGGLNSIMDSLQRIRELSVQASNSAVYSSSEMKAFQAEIDQLKESINDVSKYTQFNGMNLLDGSKDNWNIATNPDGSGAQISTSDSTLEMLGIKDYDVSKGNFDISVIDDAINKVNESLSNIGATSNVLDHQIELNGYASYNMTGAQSRIEDLDIPKAVSEKEKERLLEEYRMMLMKKQMEDDSNVTKLLQF